jgi:hypothetical protein
MPNSTRNPSSDEPNPLNTPHSHSGDEEKPQGAFKSISYDKETGGASVEVTPASREAREMASTAPGDDSQRTSRGASADNLDDMTVEQLHEEATRLNIEGRGSMNKAELQKAVRKAQK